LRNPARPSACWRDIYYFFLKNSADENRCANQRSRQRKISVIAGTVDHHLTKSGRP
jgi:hypothetical protein